MIMEGDWYSQWQALAGNGCKGVDPTLYQLHRVMTMNDPERVADLMDYMINIIRAS